MSFFCCCTPGISGHEVSVLTGDTSGAFQELASDPQAGAMHASKLPNFPGGTSAKIDGSWNQGDIVARATTEDSWPATRAATEDSWNSNSSMPKKEVEKIRLQELVRGFSGRAVTGIQVELIDPEQAQVSSYLFKMDKYLYNIYLESIRDDSRIGDSSTEDRSFNFKLKAVTKVCKGQDATNGIPALANFGNNVVTMEVDSDCEQERICFHFSDVVERDKFYTCLKILRMSVEISDKNSDKKA